MLAERSNEPASPAPRPGSQIRCSHPSAPTTLPGPSRAGARPLSHSPKILVAGRRRHSARRSARPCRQFFWRACTHTHACRTDARLPAGPILCLRVLQYSRPLPAHLGLLWGQAKRMLKIYDFTTSIVKTESVLMKRCQEQSFVSGATTTVRRRPGLYQRSLHSRERVAEMWWSRR